MGAFEALADPVRRRLLQVLDGAELPAGALVAEAAASFGITQPAVSQHLKVLREHGLVLVRADGARRLYRVDRAGLAEVAAYLDGFATAWDGPLEALATEVARGRRQRADTPEIRDATG